MNTIDTDIDQFFVLDDITSFTQIWNTNNISTKKRDISTLTLQEKEEKASKKLKTEEIAYLQNVIKKYEADKEDNNSLRELLKISQSKLDEMTINYTEENNKIRELLRISQSKLDEMTINHAKQNDEFQRIINELKQKEITKSKKYDHSNLDIIYTWNILNEQSSKCMEIYGFTSDQILELYEYIILIINTKDNKKGCKSTHSQKTKFLVVLYFLVHNTTFKQITNNFQISSSGLQKIIITIIHQCSLKLFNWSISNENNNDKHNLIYQRYIIPINKPSDTGISIKYLINEEKIYGVYIHCIHNIISGKINYFNMNNDENVDDNWLNKYIVCSSEQIISTTSITTFETRMKNKFLIMSSKYRGDITELYDIIQFVIALTNLDLGFNNIIIV